MPSTHSDYNSVFGRRESLKRFMVEEGAKPAIFGSYSYDPVKQVFVPPPPEQPKNNDNNNNKRNQETKPPVVTVTKAKTKPYDDDTNKRGDNNHKQDDYTNKHEDLSLKDDATGKTASDSVSKSPSQLNHKGSSTVGVTANKFLRQQAANVKIPPKTNNPEKTAFRIRIT